ncbi:MAG TPA: phosphonate metabolism protein/1,5-bisphosphokinase (PRPP-forming) PhnN [Herbaspirillum sp.]|nr:phosphonate metabolism protein/1,5-bisphosphokinase (PRPP-forming) PhnN [Herbaspirillum sp.]
MTDTARYAIYFAPAASSVWWTAGSRWLGRDAETGADYLQPAIAGMSPAAFRQITSDPRRYGFHATLKAPFRLAEGFSEAHLLAMAQAFVAQQQALQIEGVGIHTLSNFLALQTTDPSSREQISALAMRCTRYFDLLRAAPSAAELAKRRNADLTPRREALIARWGYPYTEEEYRFHMTLTGALTTVDAAAAAAIGDAAGACFAAALATPLTIDGLAIFKEPAPGAPMHVWQRLPFSKHPASHAGDVNTSGLPPEGRLFFVVGPSGVGKDSLLEWVKTRLPADAGPVFARRSITRPAHASEAHEPMTQDAFQHATQAGHFSMIWQANDTCYGIRRDMEAELKAGRDVVVNGSREYIPQLRQLFPQAKILWISADPAAIRQRIEGRSRETGAALENRLQRITAFNAEEVDGVTHIDNSGPLEIAGHRLLEIFSAAWTANAFK